MALAINISIMLLAEYITFLENALKDVSKQKNSNNNEHHNVAKSSNILYQYTLAEF